MSVLAQDSSGDLVFTEGRMDLKTEADETLIRIYNRLLLAEGEWFLDTRIGIPYWRFVFVKNPDIPLLTRLFREAISKVPGVGSVDSLSLALDSNRQLVMTFAVTHTNGDVIEGGLGQPFIADEDVKP